MQIAESQLTKATMDVEQAMQTVESWRWLPGRPMRALP